MMTLLWSAPALGNVAVVLLMFMFIYVSLSLLPPLPTSRDGFGGQGAGRS